MFKAGYTLKNEALLMLGLSWPVAVAWRDLFHNAAHDALCLCICLCPSSQCSQSRSALQRLPQLERVFVVALLEPLVEALVLVVDALHIRRIAVDVG